MNDFISLEKALAAISNPSTFTLILEDLLSPKEILALQERWKVCQLIHAGHSYRAIHQKLGASFSTINRIARCLNEGQGYKHMIENSL